MRAAPAHPGIWLVRFPVPPVGTVLAQQAADVCRVILHPVKLLQNLGDALRRPALVPETVGFRALFEQRGKPGKLLIRQCCAPTRYGALAQGVPAPAFAGTPEPLADRSLRDPEFGGNPPL